MTERTFLGDVVVGPHCPATNWLFALIVELARDADRPVLRIDRFDHIDFLTTRRPIILTCYPSRQLIDLIASDDVRVLYVMEDPITVLHYMHTILGVSPIEAIRSQTASAVANLAIGRTPCASTLYANSERSLRQVAADTLQHLQVSGSAEKIEKVLETISKVSPETKLSDAFAAQTDPWKLEETFSIPSALTSACNEILSPLLAMTRHDAVRPIVWPTAVFKLQDQPDTIPPKTIDIDGPSRVILYGPYLYLPPARYRVEAIMAFSEDIKDVPFILEVHGGNWLAKARIEERRAGHYRGYFYLDHHEPTSSIEIRLRNERAVASGRLSLVELLFFVDDMA